MKSNLMRSVVCGVLTFGACAIVPTSAAAPMTSAQALASVKFLAGTWHCTGGGPTEDDVYTIKKNTWQDTDSLGDVTNGTFDAKRQKWVILSMNASGAYSVNDAAPAVNDQMHVTTPYPPGMSSQKFTFAKLSDSKYKLGKQVCVKK